jgi:hypothetical protein
MEHVVIFVCIQMQLQTVLYFTYNMIFITIFKIKHKLHTASGSTTSPPPPARKNSRCAPGYGYKLLPIALKTSATTLSYLSNVLLL